MARAVGIDLGTTNSVICVLEGGEPTVVINSEGARTTPSVVAFTKSGDVLVGEAAKRQAVTNVERTFRSVKRHMGTDWSVTIDGKRYTAQEISARVLMKLKRDAEAYLGETITDAVITVPAYFEDAQRQATKEAGQIAGLNVLRVINEPTAAGLAYGLDKGGKEQTVVVVHFGGGTFDVSLLKIGEGVVEVLATSGNTYLGGDDWDQRIVDHLVKTFYSWYGVDLSKDKMAMQRLREAAEKAKIELSSQLMTTINLPYITRSAKGPLQLDISLTRAEFQRMTADLIDRCRTPFNNVIKDAGVSIGSIDHVVLVGGSTRMPAVGDLIRELTGGKEPNRGVNPDEVVGTGAALQAGVLKGEVKDLLLLDVTPLSLGIETKGGVMAKLIERNTTIPTKRSEIFTTAGGTELTSAPSFRDSQELDLDDLIHEGTDSVQAREKSQVREEKNYQSLALIHVYEGEREIAAYNKKLGAFELTGLPPAPRGIPQIEVTFDIDANGMVHVSARDLGTGKEQSMTITGGSALPKDEIDRMIRDAEAHAEEDRRRREEAETRNQAETLGYPVDADVVDESVTADEPGTAGQRSSAGPGNSVSRDRIFLCHSHGDKEAVRRLYGRLRADGFDPWLDEEDLLPGQDWAFEIRQAMRASRLVLVCLSASSAAKRGFVQREIRFALDVADEQPEGSIYLIPARLEPCEVPERLSRWHAADLFIPGGYDRLLRMLRREM